MQFITLLRILMYCNNPNPIGKFTNTSCGVDVHPLEELAGSDLVKDGERFFDIVRFELGEVV